VNSGPSHIPKEDELLGIILKKGLTAQSVLIYPKEQEIMLNSSDLQVIIDFAIAFDIRMLFYDYHYLYKEDYIFKDINKNRYGIPTHSVIQNLFREHNEKMDSIDFSVPLGLSVFCLYEGHSVSILLTDPQMLKLSRNSLEEIEINIYNSNEESISKLKSENNKAREKLCDELINIILDDSEFKKRTNQSLRELYLDELLLKEENKKFNKIFQSDDFGTYHNYKTFLSKVSLEQKNRKDIQ